jgi:hypothetical protein
MASSGVTYQGHVPPAKSLAADWSIAGTAESDQMFSVSLNPGDVIQLDVTYQLQNSNTAVYVESTITSGGMAAGYLYAFSLDRGGKLSQTGRLAAV